MLTVLKKENLHSILFSREERRWMERENKTKRQKKKKDELQRIRNLVGINAYTIN